MSKTELIINCVPGEECRIAIVTDGKLEELYQERASVESHVGNIYKGRILNVEPSIQAAFIDFGLERNGFLHISDLHPRYFPGKNSQDAERVGKKMRHRDRPPIQQCLQRGQDILVQILKEGIGTKGPTLTSYLSIPGRYLVMMPYMERLGVSRKVEDDEARRQVRKTLDELNPPKDFGFIIRTAGIQRTKVELKRDLAYLLRLWKILDQRRNSNIRVGELYAESDLVIRTIRDVFSPEVERIIVDNEDAARRAQAYLDIASPRATSKVFRYDDQVPLFYRYGIEQQIEMINNREVILPSGGSLVIDSTEALVAIDVNSGKMRNNQDSETTAYKTDLEATDEICRQLRLRDLGGVIVIDLIDMREAKHRRTVEQRFRLNLKNDRARTKILSISQFGLLEMTRQRVRPSLAKSLSVNCPHCEGMGQVKSPESVVLDVIRRLTAVMHITGLARVDVTVSPDVAFHLLNRKRGDLVQLENHYHVPVMVRVHHLGPVDHIELTPYDERGSNIESKNQRKTPEPNLISVDKLTPIESSAQDTDTLTDDDVAKTIPNAKVTPAGKNKPRYQQRRRGNRNSKVNAPPTEHNSTNSSVEVTKMDDAKPSPPSRGRSRRRSRKRQTTAKANVQSSQATTETNKSKQSTAPPSTTTATSVSRGYKNTVVGSSAKQDRPST